MRSPKISLLPQTAKPILSNLQFYSCDYSGNLLRTKSNRIQDKPLYKSRNLGKRRELCTKIYSELYPEKIILDMISRVIGVMWCVRSEDAEFC